MKTKHNSILKQRPQLYILGLLLLLLYGNYDIQAQDSDCLKSIRTGKFESVTEDGQGFDYTVIRKKKKQIEIFNNGKSKVISKIDWIDDSNYTLTTLKWKNANSGCDHIGAVAYVEILNCDESIQVLRWQQDGCGEGLTRLRRVD